MLVLMAVLVYPVLDLEVHWEVYLILAVPLHRVVFHGQGLARQ